MTTQDIAQQVFDKARAVTVTSRVDELLGFFAKAGIRMSPDGTKVVAAGDPACFEKLSKFLATEMPTAMIGIKRVLAKNDIQV